MCTLTGRCDPSLGKKQIPLPRLPSPVCNGFCLEHYPQSQRAVRPHPGPLLSFFSCWFLHKMANVLLEFKASAGDSEPQTRPVLIIGQQANLQQASWSQIKGKLQPVVSKEVRLNVMIMTESWHSANVSNVLTFAVVILWASWTNAWLTLSAFDNKTLLNMAIEALSLIKTITATWSKILKQSECFAK